MNLHTSIDAASTRLVAYKHRVYRVLSRFQSKIRNWIEKRKQIEWEVCEKYGTRQLCMEGPTDRYVQFICKLNRKHCRMLVGLLTGHINQQYMLHKMRWAKTSSCRRCGAGKGNVGTHSMRMPGFGEGKDADPGLCQDGFGTNKRGEAKRDRGPW